MKQCLKVYLLPGVIFVSVVLGGGYGTGREVVEYFTSYGLKGGLLGVGLMLLFVALLILLGRTLLEGILTYWSVGMYVVFGLYLMLVISGAEVNVFTEVAQGDIKPGWFIGGLLYTMYNVAIAPVLLFTARVLQTRRQAVGAGVIAAVLVMLPAFAFHLSYAVDLATATAAPLPNYQMIQQYAPQWLLLVFLIALMGTLIQTGAGLLQGVIERVTRAVQPASPGHSDTELPLLTRSGIAVVALTISGSLSSFGIVALIAKGYSAMAIGFGLVYVLPLLVTTLRRFRLFTIVINLFSRD